MSAGGAPPSLPSFASAPRLELASTLARDPEHPSHLGQDVLSLAPEPVSQLYDSPLALIEAPQRGRELARLGDR